MINIVNLKRRTQRERWKSGRRGGKKIDRVAQEKLDTIVKKPFELVTKFLLPFFWPGFYAYRE